MSDWEIDNSASPPQSSSITKPSDWAIEQENDSSNQTGGESLPYSLAAAPFRIGTDLFKSAYQKIQNIPEEYRQAKMNIPAAYNAIKNDPINAARQIASGFPELGHTLLNMPHNIAEYASSRLNLIPEVTASQVPQQRDITQDINQFYGTPKNAGENVLRSLVPGSFNAMGELLGAKALNPLQLTNKGIANRVVNELNNQVDKHSTMYNSLWDKAQQQGYNQVPFDRNALTQDMNVIGKSYTDKQMKSVNNLLQNPTLENAQKAQSDLGVLRRSIEEKAKTTPLLQGEKDIYDALSNAEKNVEGNMFKDANGNLNNVLKNHYDKITNSYRENVVPYKYDPNIQAYMSKNITAKELVQRLQGGPFAAKKGGLLTHPQFGIRNALLPALGGLAGIGGIKYLYDQAVGNPVAQNK